MIRRRHHHHEIKTGHERWLVSYADFITLLFAFFVVMYSVSQVSDQKYRVLSETLASVFDGKVPIDAQIKELMDKYPLDETGQISGLSPLVNEVDTEILAKDLAESLVQMVKSGDVSILAMEDSVEINMNANALFESGSAEPSDAAKLTFKQVADHLQAKKYKVEVAGHTDNIPIKTSQYANNWALSSARATSIVGLLAEGGVNPTDLKASGFGEYQPISDNNTAIGRAQNRRVVLTVTKPIEPKATQNTHEREPLIVPLSPDAQPTNTPDDAIEPVRLKNGGLLFSRDPELPRSQ